jgi:hypothetical protein
MQNKEEYYPLIKQTAENLKDFQAKTVDYVYEQLYTNGRKKMLVADEVGLGKTIIAKGIIAKSFENYLDNYDALKKENPTFNVVYICSNLALANQNIRKLNFTGKEECVEETINRLNYLAFENNETSQLFKINSLTPGTSFDQRSSSGEAKERVILYKLLTAYDVFERRSNGIMWMLKGPSGSDNWKRHINDDKSELKSDLYRRFRDELNEIVITKERLPKTFAAINTSVETTIWKGLQKLSDLIDGRNFHLFNFQNEIIRELRRILAYLCLEYLGADIFILDEFQRYAKLIKTDATDDPAIELARRVFQIKNAKVLMLSATPFKPYTNDFDEASGEVHYKEFKSVLQFLMEHETESFWKEFETDRKNLYEILRHSDKIAAVYEKGLAIKNRLETTYRRAIVRTERLLASENKDAMIFHADAGKTLKLQKEDIHDFVILDRITQHLNKNHNSYLTVPVEYVKSCPYSLSFLDSYQHKEKLRKKVGDDKELQKLLKESTHAWLDFERLSNYLPLIPSKGNMLPNAKLRLLIEKTVNSKVSAEAGEETTNEGWKYLWIPPSLPYYELSGAYQNSWGFSKSLLFSSWKMVPRMVAGLVSYEAERLSIGNKNSISEREQQEERRDYFQKRRTPRPQFTFKNSQATDTPDQMNNYLLLYPCFYLADLYNPQDNLSEQLTLKQFKKGIANKIKGNLEESGILNYGKEGGDVRKWYWLAPLLLDKYYTNVDVLRKWLNESFQDNISIDAEDQIPDKEEGKGKSLHRAYVNGILNGTVDVEVGLPNAEQLEDLCSHLADLCLASPAICLLRSFSNHFGISADLLSSVYSVASSFITLFNKPESIAVIRLTTTAREYHRSVIEYCVAGNIQSMLDEYIYLLYHCDNYLSHKHLAEHFSDILSLRSSSVEVDDYKSFRATAIEGDTNRKKTLLRTHYAMDFGSQKLTSASSDRLINMRQTFNSPFRPFVLATTSIGQEGLDFHLYCRKIFHWNLPSNPIDFEQREGRIHRYKGHVIRLNLARKYGSKVSTQNKNIWETIFHEASAEKDEAKVKCDLIPFWHINHGPLALNIERYVPIYPFSKDVEKFRQMIKVLTYYRLTFGQPRQEDLVECLSSLGYESNEIELLDDLMMKLSPLLFHNLKESS